MPWNQHKTVIVLNSLFFFLFLLKIRIFEISEKWIFGKCILCIINCYFQCVYWIRCLFLYRWTYLKDIFIHFLKISRSVNNVRTRCFFFLLSSFFCFQKPYIYWYLRREILLVFAAVIVTGMVGGKYYWYCRR